MKKVLHKAWKHVLVTGICSLLFGIITLAWPAVSLITFVWMFAAFITIQGLSVIAGAWQSRQEDNTWWLLLLYGILAVVTGIIAALYPGLTAIILGVIISVYLIVGGLLQIIMAIRLRKEIQGEGWLILSGVLTLIAGIYLLMVPGGGALAMLWLIAVAAVILGILFILLALKARSRFRDIQLSK